ncbi:DNA mismatch repair protein MutS [Flavobacterium sp. NST-5]|uniref:DNA mismatch repair protein MutS n=1 Tax=Flavobacterium ichthyis TaxID=2698827 RepID=A0ABW9Z6C5_9FLAO|nr:Smr/MutS family protein [Flavobacterium ichthyis]NBL64246.1 DNA mismatch repair protein MutS [Flavobacterium ichthyis]
MFKKGDKVTVLDDDFSGEVISVNQNRVKIETTDGFVLEFNDSELILIETPLKINFSVQNINQVLKEKEIPKPRSFVKEKKDKHERGIPEFDLHIEKLVRNKKGMSNHEILTLQLETAQRHVEFAIKNRIPKIVLIHGVGEGTLKTEIDYMLNRFEEINFQDADYQKYGSGATEVYVKQNKNR